MKRRQWLGGINPSAASSVLPDVEVTVADSHSGSPIRLDMNENPYGMSEKTAQAISAAVHGSNRYPRGEREALRDLIAAREKVPSDWVLVGAGCTDIFSLVCLLYGAEGKEVLAAEPNYYLFDYYMERLQGKLVRVPVNERWETDVEAMARRVSGNTSLVYLCNPNNPTGTIADPERLRQFCEETARRPVLFVDEAYYELVDESRRVSMIELVRKGANLVVGRTFSKTYGLAGLRVGYGIGDPDLIAEMGRIHMDLAPVNALGLAAARAAYLDTDYIALSRQRNAQVRAGFYGVLEGLGYDSIPGSQTNFVTFRAGGQEKRLVADLRERHGIYVHGTHFLGADWIRVSMGTLEEMQRLVAALQELA